MYSVHVRTLVYPMAYTMVNACARAHARKTNRRHEQTSQVLCFVATDGKSKQDGNRDKADKSLILLETASGATRRTSVARLTALISESADSNARTPPRCISARRRRVVQSSQSATLCSGHWFSRLSKQDSQRSADRSSQGVHVSAITSPQSSHFHKSTSVNII